LKFRKKIKLGKVVKKKMEGPEKKSNNATVTHGGLSSWKKMPSP